MKILIADDEDYTREGLLEEIDWEEFGIDEIMQAVNGEEALKIVKWFRPHIVISDIRMPKMDGIAFAEELLGLAPESKIIFISGYLETEYLKSAIRLSVIDFIEKPIDVDQVRKALGRAVEEVLRERRTREADEGNREFRQQKLFELLTRRDSDWRTAERLAREVDFPLNGRYVCMAVQFPRAGQGRSWSSSWTWCSRRRGGPSAYGRSRPPLRPSSPARTGTATVWAPYIRGCWTDGRTVRWQWAWRWRTTGVSSIAARRPGPP